MDAYTSFILGPKSAIIFSMWSVNYCLLVFIAVLGVIQLAAVHNNIRSLLFFRSKILTVCFAVVAIGFAMFVFFTWNDFVPIIIEGPRQTCLFVLSTPVAIIFTLVFSSAVNYQRFVNGNSAQDGLEALRDNTFIRAMRNQRGKK